MPPIPPRPVKVALQNARFHCPRMLLAWYAMIAGILAFAPAVARKTPKYRTEPFFAKPRIGRPIKAMAQLKTITGALVRYLSPNHAVPYINITAMTYGGAPSDWEAARPKPRVSLRMIGRKKAKLYVTVVEQLSRRCQHGSTAVQVMREAHKKIKAKPQISISFAGLR